MPIAPRPGALAMAAMVSWKFTAPVYETRVAGARGAR
jgi:hypothetical protein